MLPLQHLRDAVLKKNYYAWFWIVDKLSFLIFILSLPADFEASPKQDDKSLLWNLDFVVYFNHIPVLCAVPETNDVFLASDANDFTRRWKKVQNR